MFYNTNPELKMLNWIIMQLYLNVSSPIFDLQWKPSLETTPQKIKIYDELVPQNINLNYGNVTNYLGFLFNSAVGDYNTADVLSKETTYISNFVNTYYRDLKVSKYEQVLEVPLKPLTPFFKNFQAKVFQTNRYIVMLVLSLQVLILLGLAYTCYFLTRFNDRFSN